MKDLIEVLLDGGWGMGEEGGGEGVREIAFISRTVFSVRAVLLLENVRVSSSSSAVLALPLQSGVLAAG